jgi:hypothetical protein
MISLLKTGSLLDPDAKMPRCVSQLIGWFLLLLPLLPLQRLCNKLAGLKYATTPEEWALGIVITLSLAWLLSISLPDRILCWAGRLISSGLESPSKCLEGFVICALGLGLTLSSFYVFNNRSHVVDSSVQLFQAQIFAAGKLAAPAPKHIGFFITQHMLTDEYGWYSQYPPGHAALLALGILLGLPWFICILLSLVSAVFIYLFTREVYGLRTAKLSLLLLLFCPFFFFLGTSFMNHCSALCLISMFCYFFARWTKRPDAKMLFLAGFALGLCFLSRPLSSIAAAIPLGLAGAVVAWERRQPMSLFWGVLGFSLTAIWFFVFNHYAVGDAFLPGYVKLWGGAHGLGCHKSPWGEMHTPATGLKNELADLWQLNRYLFEWPIPSLIPVAMFFLLPARRRKWDQLLLLSFLSFPACYFFYWYRARFLGPRFLYESLVFVIPLTARALDAGVRQLSSVNLKIPHLFAPVPASTLVSYLIFLCLTYTLLVGYPGRAIDNGTKNQSMKMDLVKEAQAQGIPEGIIFIANGWGERLLANLREFGLSASEGEEAYRTCDHCLLQHIVDRARAGKLSPSQVRAKVQMLIDRRMTLINPDLNNDATLKIRPNIRLSSRCQDEIMYDQQGYMGYFPHLTENSPFLDAPFIVARDLRGRNRELMDFYPGKPAYLFRAGKFTRIETD